MCTFGKIGGLAEAFQSEPPFHRARVFGLNVFRPLFRWKPESGDPVEPGADVIVDAIRDEYRNMIDQAVRIRVFRKPERMGMQGILQPVAVGVTP